MKFALVGLAAVAVSCYAVDARRAPQWEPSAVTALVPAKAAQPRREPPQDADRPLAAEALVGAWQTNVPGATYLSPGSSPDYGVPRVHSSAAFGLLSLSADGTYSWNSWGGRRGRWVQTGQPDYPIQLIDGADHRYWRVGLDSGTGELIVRSGAADYRGRRAALQ